MKKVTIIGAGFSGLYAACYLAKAGYDVEVFEKNATVGGRAQVYEAEGFTFDMGPSWYWMPELIDSLFTDLGENRSDYFNLIRLDPSYKVFWKDSASEVPAEMQALKQMFDDFEPKGGEKLEKFLSDAQNKYDIAVPEFLEKPGLKLNEVINFNVLKKALKMDVFKSVDKDVQKRFTSPKSIGLLNFPVLFLGEMPNRIPSLYTLMNYADMGLGTWYPEGGMGSLANAFQKIAEKAGVRFHFNSPVDKFTVENDKVSAIEVNGENIVVDQLLASADYNFVEQHLVPKKYRRYNSSYWENRRMAPSSLIFYLGVDKSIGSLLHHNLFFDEDIDTHGKEIYDHPKWPSKPLFYVCAPSKTDPHVAPAGNENIFILMPIAPGLEDTQEMREHYYNLIIDRIESKVNEPIRDHIIYKKSFAINDFKSEYNSFKGNAYGLANTLKQTANLKPKITSKLENLFYCGQLTVPGPGVPPSLISGKVVANHIMQNYERTV
ncbi:phytoene desaturase family protein [Crocinitomix sp.]|nr:phytoene desaturase family protein [Crocinitomix sp.]